MKATLDHRCMYAHSGRTSGAEVPHCKQGKMPSRWSGLCQICIQNTGTQAPVFVVTVSNSTPNPGSTWEIYLTQCKRPGRLFVSACVLACMMKDALMSFRSNSIYQSGSHPQKERPGKKEAEAEAEE